MLPIHSWPVRKRLTLWYVLVVAGVLMVYAAVTSVVLYLQLQNQLTRFAIQDVETIEGLLYFAPDHQLELNDSYHNHPQSRQVLERLLEVLSPDGQVLLRNERLGTRALGGPLLPNEGVDGYSVRRVSLANGSRALVVSRRHILNGTAIIIRLGYEEHSIWARMDELFTASLLALPLVLLLAGLAGYQLARKSLAPLEEIASTAERITAENLSERLPVNNPGDEVGHVARVFNSVLARLEESFERLQRFTLDASHELRTPLAALRSVGEVGLQKNQSATDYQDTIGSMLEEVNRLTRLVENLLNISRADARQLQFSLTAVSPIEIIREVAAVLDVLLEEKALELRVTGEAAVMVKGDRMLLRQAITNVMHNAVKYTPTEGRIAVDVASEISDVIIRVADTGPGIAKEHRTKVFDRFYRVDSARARDTGGAGLGLSIAKWAVEIQGGSIGVEDSEQGAVFVLKLPAASGNLS